MDRTTVDALKALGKALCGDSFEVAPGLTDAEMIFEIAKQYDGGGSGSGGGDGRLVLNISDFSPIPEGGKGNPVPEKFLTLKGLECTRYYELESDIVALSSLVIVFVDELAYVTASVQDMRNEENNYIRISLAGGETAYYDPVNHMIGMEISEGNE